MRKANANPWRKAELPGEMWHEKLQCHVTSLSVQFDTEDGRPRGVLRMPKVNCCNMDDCISLFQSIYPDIEDIQTWSADEADTAYLKRDGKWQIWLRGNRYDRD